MGAGQSFDVSGSRKWFCCNYMKILVVYNNNGVLYGYGTSFAFLGVRQPAVPLQHWRKSHDLARWVLLNHAI